MSPLKAQDVRFNVFAIDLENVFFHCDVQILYVNTCSDSAIKTLRSFSHIKYSHLDAWIVPTNSVSFIKGCIIKRLI